ncbi:MAG: sugar transferase [Candidatus Binatia bacterium]|nr:sugar transferase [Candidatus Binatia bacterium]
MSRTTTGSALANAGTPGDSAVRSGWRHSIEQRALLLLLFADAMAVLLAYSSAFLVRIWVPLPLTAHLLPPQLVDGPHSALGVALVTQFPLLYFFGLYDMSLLRRELSLLVAPLLALVTQLLVIAGWYFFRGDDVSFPRSVLVIFTLVNFGFVVASRFGIRRVLREGRRILRVALVGQPKEVAELGVVLHEASSMGHAIEVVGAIRVEGFGGAGEPVPNSDLTWLGGTRDLGQITDEGRVDQVILVPSESGREGLLDRVLRATDVALPPRVAVVPSVHELLIGRLASLSIDDVPLIEVARDPREELAFTIKTGLDYVLATALILFAAPVCAVAALAIRLTSPGPIFYRQRRVGQAGSEFMMYKLRTMRDGAEEETGPVLAYHGDARVTAAGRFLRATRIDEIPQLLNVLNGTMSLIGPRPERPEFVEGLVREIPGYAERWLVKPGLSGLAQVRGEYDTSAVYKLKYDLAYIHNYSLLLDIRIMVETVKALLTRQGI